LRAIGWRCNRRLRPIAAGIGGFGPDEGQAERQREGVREAQRGCVRHRGQGSLLSVYSISLATVAGDLG